MDKYSSGAKDLHSKLKGGMVTNKTEKSKFWKGVFEVFVFASCLIFLSDQWGYESSDDFKDVLLVAVDAVIYDKEGPKLILRTMNGWWSTIFWEGIMAPEETQAEINIEAKMLANWKANFSYQSTADPDVVMIEETIHIRNSATPPFSTHGFLKRSFRTKRGL